MEDVFCTTEGTRIGYPVVLVDEVEFVAKCQENCIAKDGDTNGGDEVFALATSGPATSCSEFRSVQIESMMTNRSEFKTELEFWTAHSKVHWSELSHERASSSEEQSGLDHRHYFEKLQKDAHWGPFCNRVTNVVLGKKLGEGAQADIYEARIMFKNIDDTFGLCKSHEYDFVVKVMKGDFALEDLLCQWPSGIVESVDGLSLLNMCGALVKEPISQKNKFGFVMKRFWGDLRSLIDLRMEHKNAKGPPFSLLQAKNMMYWITKDMIELHRRGIIHKDLKASNMLVAPYIKEDDILSSNDRGLIDPFVADWECSVSVVGTGFWRAPKILQQLKCKTPSSELVFNEKVDVYSFAMTCYEIVTGLTLFEGLLHGNALRDAVLDGSRPALPHDLDLDIRAMITSFWDPNPSLRPSFDKLKSIYMNKWRMYKHL